MLRGVARGLCRQRAFDTGDFAELDGQFFGRRGQGAHAVAHRRERVVALELEPPQGQRPRLGFLDQELRAGDGDDVAGDDESRAGHRDAVDTNPALGGGIEQPAPGDHPQCGHRRCIRRGGGIGMVRPHRPGARVDDHARAILRLALRGAQHDGGVQ